MTGRILDAGSMSKTDRHFLHQAFEQAKLGYDEGGCPIGSVLALGDQLIGRVKNAPPDQQPAGRQECGPAERVRPP